ncbi:MAG: amino acid permease [Acidobacteria bacterium]|nr:amino acid permease [Acidobacteriota bacterium]
MQVSTSSPPLARQLGPWSSIGLVIGITIGSGIFRTPAGIAARVPDPQLMLFAWILGGIITLCGALSIAELAASLPQTGGLYVYLREGWGRMPAFLFGWAQLVLIRAAAVGSIATVFGEYLLRSIGIDPIVHAQAADDVAAGAIVFASIVNIRGALWGAAIAGLSTVAKYGALMVLVLASFMLGSGHGGSFSHLVAAGGDVQIGLFGLALVSVLWAYDGFADLSFAGGEVSEPQRNLPRALVLGTLAIIAIYVLANAAYLYLIPIDGISTSPLVAADTMNILFGQFGVALVSVVVMISTFGSLNGSMLVQPRIFFAMADDKLFFEPIARVHPRFKTPYVAISLAGLLGVVFVLAGTFEQLIDAFVKAMLPFYGLSVAAIFTLRTRRPDLARPYRVVGYPVVPIVYILGVIYLIANALVTDTFWTLVVFGVVLAGIPVYYVAFGRQPR